MYSTLRKSLSIPRRLARDLVVRLGMISPRLDDLLRMSNGIVHVGANTGQERELYDRYELKVVWIEPIDDVFDELTQNIAIFPKQSAFKALLTSQVGENVTLNIANNGGASSSLFDLARHKEIWPDVHYVHQINVSSRTLDDLIASGDIDVTGCDFLVMDVQGAELMVLKGSEKFLRALRFIRLEAADFEAYQGAPLRKDIQEFLEDKGFREVAAEAFKSKDGVGTCYDVTFRRNFTSFAYRR